MKPGIQRPVLPADRGRHVIDGAVRVFLGDALFPLTAIVTAAVLTRRLGADGYGAFTLAASIITWVEWSIAAVFARSTLKLIGSAPDWNPIGAAAVRLYLWVSGLVALMLVVMAQPLAAALGEPALTPYLRLLALDIPIFGLAQAHLNILLGLGGFRQRALVSAGRSLARLVLIVALVEAGLSVTGAILGSIGASVVELLIARRHVRPSLLGRLSFPMRRLWDHAVPLFLSAICTRLVQMIGLPMVTVLGGTLADAGHYGAAQGLSILPRLVASTFSPLLLATLTHALSDGDNTHARDMGRDASRLAFLVLPFAGMLAGAATEIVGLVFGAAFTPAAAPFAWLIFAGTAMVMISSCGSTLTAGGKPGWTLSVSAPMLATAIVAGWWLIPRFGTAGAALATAAAAALGVVGSAMALHRMWRIGPPWMSILRGLVLCVAAYALAASWPTPGFLLLVKLTVISALIGAGFLMLREFTPREIALIRSVIPRKARDVVGSH